MEPLFYVMAIMGCTDGTATCADARIEPVQYRSVQACQAAMPAALMRNSDLEFPEISAACRATRQRSGIAGRQAAKGRTTG